MKSLVIWVKLQSLNSQLKFERSMASRFTPSPIIALKSSVEQFVAFEMRIYSEVMLPIFSERIPHMSETSVSELDLAILFVSTFALRSNPESFILTFLMFGLWLNTWSKVSINLVATFSGLKEPCAEQSRQIELTLCSPISFCFI